MSGAESIGTPEPLERALPADPQIPALCAIREHGVQETLAGVGASGPVTEVAVLRHHPGSRCTLLVRVGRARFVLKAFRKDISPKIQLFELVGAAGLTTGRQPTVAALLAFDRTLRFLILEWLDGPTCLQLMQQAAGARAGELAATWLRAAAKASVPAERYGRQELLADARKWVRRIGEADRELGLESAAYVRVLETTHCPEGKPVLQHGSLSVNHVLDLPSGPAVIDIDRLSRGPIERDAGRFLATVSRAVGERTELAAEAERATDALREGLAGLVDERALGWYRAAALVKDVKMLCARQPPRWRERAALHLAQAADLLGSGR